MTTIAYVKGKIAIDSHITAGEIIVDRKAEKYVYVEDPKTLLLFCGPSHDTLALVEQYKSGRYAGEANNDGLIVAVRPDFIEQIHHDAGVICRIPMRSGLPRAFGSGSSFALAAMEMGASAEEAVSLAANFDVYTGGQVTVFDVATLRIESVRSVVYT